MDDQVLNQGVQATSGTPGGAAGMMDLPPLLLGTYTPKIDAKGRMALPAKLRGQLGPGMVMARG